MRVFLISRPGINISQACLSELAGPQGVRSVEEAAEQDKWEGSGRWFKIIQGSRGSQGAENSSSYSKSTLKHRGSGQKSLSYSNSSLA